jgi:hypothetical protein
LDAILKFNICKKTTKMMKTVLIRVKKFLQ